MSWFHSVSELADFCGSFAGAIQDKTPMDRYLERYEVEELTATLRALRDWAIEAKQDTPQRLAEDALAILLPRPQRLGLDE